MAERTIVKLNIDVIRMDGDTQPREAIDADTVHEYAQAMLDGAVFPPPKVLHDGREYWLVDGFHRVHAHRQAGNKTIPVEVDFGSVNEAQWQSLAANQTHGLKRSNADKARAVSLALKRRPELSDREIARHVGVSDRMVNQHRAKLSANRSQIAETSEASKPTERTVTRAGKTYTMDTSNVGKKTALELVNEKPREEVSDFLHRIGSFFNHDDLSDAQADALRDIAQHVEAAGELTGSIIKRVDQIEQELLKPRPAASHQPEPVKVGEVIDASYQVINPVKPKPANEDDFDVPTHDQEGRAFSDTPDGTNLAYRFGRARHRLTKASSTVSTLKMTLLRDIKAADVDYTFLRAQIIDTDFQNCFRSLADARPHAICPYCSGDGCKVCGKAGWITKTLWANTPKELKLVDGQHPAPEAPAAPEPEPVKEPQPAEPSLDDAFPPISSLLAQGLSVKAVNALKECGIVYVSDASTYPAETLRLMLINRGLRPAVADRAMSVIAEATKGGAK